MNGIMSVIGSNLAMEAARLRKNGGVAYKFLIIMLGGIFLPFFVWSGLSGDFHFEFLESGFGLLIAFLLFINVFVTIARLMFNLDAVECFFLNYKKSSYYLSTKVKQRDLERDQGLVGEFRAYILSQKLEIPHKILYNVCVPMPNGNFQEIDAIIIGNKCIYVLECKNRAGDFDGNYEDEKWVQRIGSQCHETENIYLQNEKHIAAIYSYLINKGVIADGFLYCINVILTNGEMRLSLTGAPDNLVFGDVDVITKAIYEVEKSANSTNFSMEQVYEALLPYSLYTNMERTSMMSEREIRSMNKELVLGQWNYDTIYEDAAGLAEPGAPLQVRQNKCFNQILVPWDKTNYWLTSNLVQTAKPYSANQISKGVDGDRITQYKRSCKEPKLIGLKKYAKLFSLVTYGVIIVAAIIVSNFLYR